MPQKNKLTTIRAALRAVLKESKKQQQEQREREAFEASLTPEGRDLVRRIRGWHENLDRQEEEHKQAEWDKFSAMVSDRSRGRLDGY